MRPRGDPAGEFDDRVATTSCTSAEASTTSQGSAVPSARAQPLVLKGRRLERNRKFVDSPLEGDGFELPVPVRQAKLTRSCR